MTPRPATGSTADRPPRDLEDAPQLRARMVRAALDMVAEVGGLGADLQGVGFDAVIRRAGVPRTSARRIWSNRHEFHRDLVRSLAEELSRDAVSILGERRALMASMVADGLAELTTVESRRALHRRVVRASMDTMFGRLVTSPVLRSYLSVTAYTLSAGADEPGDLLSRMVSEGHAEWIELAARENAGIGELFGFHLRGGMTYAALVRTIGGCLIGLAVQQLSDPRNAVTVTLPDPDGTVTECSPAAAVAVAMFDAWVEFDADYDRDAAIRGFLLRLADQEVSRA